MWIYEYIYITCLIYNWYIQFSPALLSTFIFFYHSAISQNYFNFSDTHFLSFLLLLFTGIKMIQRHSIRMLLKYVINRPIKCLPVQQDSHLTSCQYVSIIYRKTFVLSVHPIRAKRFFNRDIHFVICELT